MIRLPFFPPQASTIAPEVDLLFLTLIGLSGFFTSLVVLLIVYFAIRYRRGSRADRTDPPTTSLRVELAWVFGLLVLGMGTYGWASFIYFKIVRQPPDALEVYVVGLQWMWKIQHPDGQSEINELHVPAGQTVRLIMTSEDVIHSFYVPAFRLKYDAIPGRYTDLWFEATQVGEYHLFCTEYCGTLHSSMIGQVVVMEPRQYQEWLAANGTGTSMVSRGEQIFTQFGCSGCHRPEPSDRAPVLVGLFGQEVMLESGETVIADENYIRQSILQPQLQIVAGYPPIMPSFEGQISEEQLAQLVNYIKSLGNGNRPGENSGADPIDNQERIEPQP